MTGPDGAGGGNPPGRGARMARVTALVQARDLEGALAEVQAAQVDHPGDLPVLARHGFVLRLMNRHEEAVALLDPVCAAHPDAIDPAVELSHALRLSGDAGRAVRIVEMALMQAPRHRGALLARVEALLSAGNGAGALRAAEAAAAILPDDLALNIRRGSLLRMQGQAGAAVTLLTALRAGAPDHPGLRIELAQALRLTGAAEAALTMVDAVLAADPAHRGAALIRADILAQTADAATLHAEILRMVAAAPAAGAPDAARLTCALAMLRILRALPGATGRDSYLAALPLLRGQIDLLGADEIVALCMGAAEAGLSSDVAAFGARLRDLPVIGAQACERCLDLIHGYGLEPAGPLVRRLLDRVPPHHRGFLDLYALSLFDGAEAALHARRAHLPRNRSVREVAHLALLLARVGRRRVAARYLAVALRAHPRNPVLFGLLVDDLILTGQADGAKRLIDRTRADLIGPEDPLHAKVVAGLLHLGELGQIDDLIALSSTDPQARHLLMQRLRALVALDRTSEADALLRRFGSAHAGARLSGKLIAEEKLIGPSSTAGAMQALYRARPALREAAARQAGTGQVPRRLFQYWDTPTPPKDILPILASWQGHPECPARLFDRRSARVWLDGQLGRDWVAAFDRAGGPAEESDFLRLCVLMTEGGLYVDADDRLVGSVAALWGQFGDFTAWMEPDGSVGNNVMAAVPRHPVIVRAALSARAALLGHSSENTWLKTGPGLVTRAVARQVAMTGTHGIVLHPQFRLAEQVQFNTPLPYKKSQAYWNARRGDSTWPDLFRSWTAPA